MNQRTIDNWYVTYAIASTYTAPELRVPILCGIADIGYGLESVLTSEIRGKRGDKVVTKNTEYELLSVNQEYENEYPNAKQRLLDSLKEV